jgi:DNA-binding NarL/FixJ family response regulator
MKTIPVKVIVVEDDPGMRESLKRILDRAHETRLLATLATAEEALQVIPQLSPDLVLMDINLPGMSGVECVSHLTVLQPNLVVIMLTMYENSENVFASLEAGASGYLLKPVRAAQLIAAVQEAHAGGAPMTPNIARRVVQQFKKPAAEAGELGELAQREREILDLLAGGYLQKEIADRLGISYWTVQTHIGRIYKKLHVRSRSQAVAKLHQRR